MRPVTLTKTLISTGLVLLLSSCVSTAPRGSTSKSTRTTERTAPPGVGVRPQKTPPGGTVTEDFNPVKTAQLLYDAKDYAKLQSFTKQTLENPNLSPKERESLWTYRLRAWEATNDVNTLMVTPMGDTELSLLSREASAPAFRAALALKLGESKLDERKQEEAREYFQQVVQENATPELTQRAQEYLKNLDTLRKVEPKTIGVVLPLSGRTASIAQRTLRGIQLGLGLDGSPNSSFRLAVMDSQGNPEVARRAVERLVTEDNVIAVIGGLQSKTASAEAAQAAELGVPTLSLSLKSGVTELSPLVFRNSLTTEMQVRRLVRTAMEGNGFKRFAILYPNDAYGVEAANLFWDEVLARGGQIAAAQTYSAKETDFRDVVSRLVGTFHVEARNEEFRARSKEMTDAAAGKSRSARLNTKENVLPPQLDFDAIFIPDSLKAFGQIAATLSYSEVRNVKLLGTNLWNVDGLAKRSGNFASNLIFVDSYSAKDSRFQNSSFVRTYRKEFNADPGLFEVQGYDSALMLRQLISQGASSRTSLAKALTDLRNLPGLLGPLSVGEDREVLRPVVALTVEKGEILPWKATRTP
ncbi:MAG: penicillin-binding protein activator [Bdellovibrionaceae bacterium]|nr:penicillin-binding protein activator [Pseudobdellovibrionaceae bacterium]